MKKIFTLLCAVALLTATDAQQNNNTGNTKATTQRHTIPTHTSTALSLQGFNTPLNVQRGGPNPCDTIINLDNTDTLTLYVFSPPDEGYISGNNSYGDLTKAEEFHAAAGWTVSNAFIAFGYSHIIHPTDSVAVNIYADASGQPGAILATKYVTLASIHTADTAGIPLAVHFTTPATLTTATFYVGVVLPTTGDTIALLTNQGTNYNGRGWEQYSDNSWVSYQESYALNPYNQGNYIIAIVCPSGGGAAPVAAFTTTNGITGCDSISVTFQDQSTGTPTGLYWSFPGGTPSTSTSATPSVAYATPGTYDVLLQAANANGMNTFGHAGYVTVYESPTATATATNASSASATDGTATAHPAGGTSPYQYHWSNNATTVGVTGLVHGAYTVTVYDTHQCSATASVTVSFTSGINGVSETRATIYPNPATTQLNVEWSNSINAEIYVVDVTGKKLKYFTANGSSKSVFDIHELPIGTYLLQITDKDTKQQQTVRFDKF